MSEAKKEMTENQDSGANDLRKEPAYATMNEVRRLERQMGDIWSKVSRDVDENENNFRMQLVGSAARVAQSYVGSNICGHMPSHETESQRLYELTKAATRGLLDGLQQEKVDVSGTLEVKYDPAAFQEEQEQEPAVDPKRCIREKSVVCLECGHKTKILTKQHLAKHGLTPTEYKEKWGLKKSKSLVCKQLSRQRAEKMQEMQLWKKRRQ